MMVNVSLRFIYQTKDVCAATTSESTKSSEENKTKQKPFDLPTRPRPPHPLFLHCTGPIDSPSDTSHWSVAVAVGWESVWLCPSRPTHLVLGCRRIWLPEHLRSHMTGNAAWPVLAHGAAPWEKNVASCVFWNGSAGNYKQVMTANMWLPVRQLNYKVVYWKNYP